MRSRAHLLVFLVVVILTLTTMGVARWWNARSLAQVTPVRDVRWEGYRIEHQREGSQLSPYGALHRVKVYCGSSLAWDGEYATYDPMLAGRPVGFFGGLDADDDGELELVLCSEGVVERYIEPDRPCSVATRLGDQVSPDVRELCTSVGRSGAVPGMGFLLCILPVAALVFARLVSAALRERREEQRVGRTSF